MGLGGSNNGQRFRKKATKEEEKKKNKFFKANIINDCFYNDYWHNLYNRSCSDCCKNC